MFMLYTEDISFFNFIDKSLKFKLVTSNYLPSSDDIICIYINRICKEEFADKLERYKNNSIILVFDRNVAFYFFDTVNAPNASYLLVEEMDSQFNLCYETAKKSGMYISVYFRQVVVIKKRYNGLSNREIDVIDLLKDGYSYKEIASVTKLDYGTVRNYVSRILAVTDTDNKTELALHFQEILKDSDDY